MTSAERWSAEELGSCVDSYLEMLIREINDKPFNKAEFNRNLRQSILQKRTKASVELRMQNISAVLDGYSLPWIKGYKPRNNVGRNVWDSIVKRLIQRSIFLEMEDSKLTVELSTPDRNSVEEPYEYITDCGHTVTLTDVLRKGGMHEDKWQLRITGPSINSKSGRKIIYCIKDLTKAKQKVSNYLVKKINLSDDLKVESTEIQGGHASFSSNKKEFTRPVYWWDNRPFENLWLELTDREDLGANLHAPKTNQSGKEFWGYSFVSRTETNDIIFHFSKKDSAIIAYSIVADEPVLEEEIKWAARGSYAKGIIPYRRHGWLRNFSKHYVLSKPLKVKQILTKLEEIIEKTDDLMMVKPKKKGLYFPFELKSSRPMRPMQGYLFKFPSFMLELFPELMQAEIQPVPKRKFDHDPNEGGFSVRLL